MPRPNRVAPDGTFLATAARGTLMGNRGILHDAAGRLTHRRWRHKAWICCQVSFKGRRRAVMAPGAYTELFFLDEAVALAAGHRPCAECRRADYRRYRAAWGGDPAAAEIDAALHAARAVPRMFRQRRHLARAEDLPDGAFVLHPEDATAWLIEGQRALRYSPSGYDAAGPRPRGTLTVLTPEPSLRVLAAGYRPKLHLSVFIALS
ncbi:hypothetical protein Ga0609869_002603 [Rhodovulum iodosum]|uniref:Metal-binding protein n=1 Tax=Rhodovulum iodosum TaxID=68291 RepID=A0ABV3XWX9_9RHOB|nr:hypothetical protein [Rhodovulum robiginosum]RSK33566.1 hypothetical protein EJA01_09770 [Rhodovulum robiginosum]